MRTKIRNKLKQIVLELLLIVGFALVLSAYIAAAESIVVILICCFAAGIFENLKIPEFLHVFRLLLIPNFIVLHIEFARMFKEHDLKGDM